jgi:hypothetical protein
MSKAIRMPVRQKALISLLLHDYFKEERFSDRQNMADLGKIYPYGSGGTG